jgi:hypothetical protein
VFIVRTIRDTQIIYRHSVPTSQEIHHVSATKTNWLNLFRETVAVYCESHTEHTNTLSGHNAEFRYDKTGATYTNYWSLNSRLNKENTAV